MLRLTEILGRIVEIILVPLLLVAVCVVAVHGQRSPEESRLIALEYAWNQAELHNDPAALRSILDDKFTITEPNGEVLDRNLFLSSVADKSYRYNLLASGGFRVQVIGGIAIVMGTYHEVGSDKGKKFDRHGRFTDVWSLSQGNWKCLASHDSLPVK